MKTRMTGIGKPSTIALIASLLFSGAALANDLYIEQSGDDTAVTILQDGSQNKIEGLQTGDNAYIGGGGNVVNIQQVGVNNLISLSLNNPNMGGAGTGTALTIDQLGNDNVSTVQCGTALNASCSASVITQSILGDNNNVTQNLTGTGAYQSVINVTGNYNNITHTQTGVGAHTGNITMAGSGTSGSPNTISLTQSGANAKNATISSTGSGVNMSVTQHD